MNRSFFETDEFTAKAYDLKLLKRLIRYVRPHKKILFLAVFCMILSTSVHLLVPYMAKIGIDHYLASLYHVCRNPSLIEERGAERSEGSGDGEALRPAFDGKRFIKAGPQHFLVKKSVLNELSLEDRTLLLSEGALSKETYYIFPETAAIEDVGRMLGPWRLVPENSLSEVPPSVLIEIRGADLEGIMILAGLMALFIIAGMVAGYGHLFSIQIAGQYSMRDLRTHLFQHIQSMNLGFIDRIPIGRLVTRVANDIEALNEFFAAVVVNMVRDVLLVCGALVIILLLDVKLGLIVVAVVPVVAVVSAFFRNKVRGVYREVRRLLAKLNADLSEDLNGIKVIQVFNRQKARRDRFKKTNESYFAANIRQVIIFGIFRPLIDVMASVGVALVLFYGGKGVVSGALSLGALVAFVQYVRQMFKPIANMSERYNIMQRAMASLDRIFKVLDREPAVKDPADAVPLNNVAGRIEAEHVFFSYVPEKTVLKDISFSIEPGKSVAIVGPTGAGKTSIINLICRFYDPDKGCVMLDGVDIRKLPLDVLSENISIVLQDAFIFSRSVAENISLGRSMERRGVERVAELVQARDFIEQLPGGFDSVMAERGALLSMGQKQLLCFARALAHDPRILILDEATSSVDPETETKIQQAIKTLMRGRTSIVIAHRLSTIKEADEILVIDGGRILERGSHDALLAKRGIYYNLYLLQYAN